MNQKLKSKFYTKLGKVDDRIQILQLSRSRRGKRKKKKKKKKKFKKKKNFLKKTKKKKKKKKKTRCESRDMFLNQAQEDSKIRIENNRHISEWL